MTTFPENIFAGRRYAVVGLGRAGLAAMRALTDMGATVIGWDDAPFARETAAREKFPIQDPTADIGDMDALILSPGIPHRLPVPHRIATASLQAGTPILTDAELLYRAVRASGSAPDSPASPAPTANPPPPPCSPISLPAPACPMPPAPISGPPR